MSATLDDLVRIVSHRTERRRAYFRWLVETHGFVDFGSVRPPGGTIPLVRFMNVYVPPCAEPWPQPQQRVPIAASILTERLQPKSATVLLGEAGAGKTAFLKYLTLEFASGEGKAFDTGPCLPVIVSLGDYAQESTLPPLQDFIVRQLRERGLDGAVSFERIFVDAARRGELVLMFDGLDQAPEQRRRDVANRVVDFFRLHRKHGNRLVLTSHPDTYKQLGVINKVEDVDEYLLLALNDQQIDTVWDKWAGQLAPLDSAPPPALRIHIPRLAAANPGRLTAIALLSHGINFGVFDASAVLMRWLRGDGCGGAWALVRDQDASGAGSVNRVQFDVLALPSDDSSAGTCLLLNFFAEEESVREARAALQRVLSGAGSWRLVVTWALAGRRRRGAWIELAVGAIWILLGVALTTLLLFPWQSDALLLGATWSLLVLAIALVVIAIATVLRCATQAHRQGREWVQLLNRAVLLISMRTSSGTDRFRIDPASFGIPFCSAVLVILRQITVRGHVAGFWQTIGRLLESRSSEWSVFGRVTGTGAVRRDERFADKIGAASGRVLVPWQRESMPLWGRFVIRRTTQWPASTRVSRCLLLADAVLMLGGLLAPGRAVVRIAVFPALLLILLVVARDLRRIAFPVTGPSLGPVVAERRTTDDGTFRDYLIVQLVTSERPAAFVASVTGSRFWINRDGPVDRNLSFCGPNPCAAIPLEPHPEGIDASPIEGYLRVVRRRQVLWRELLPLLVLEAPLWDLRTRSGNPVLGGPVDGGPQ